MKKIIVLLISACLSLLVAEAKLIVRRNIPYLPSGDPQYKHKKHRLDVYSTSEKGGLKPVLVFIHGGSWAKGKKNTYRFFGKGFARKDIVTVIINYRLTPEVSYIPMTTDCASAVKWVYEHIKEFGGDPDQIYVSGHSAGGQLASLISCDNSFFDSLGIKNPIKGAILLDAFGTDMHYYFNTYSWKGDKSFKITFTDNPDTWKKASPIYCITDSTPRHLIFTGGKTYHSILTQNKRYYDALIRSGVQAQYSSIPEKGHIGMIFQFTNKKSLLYKHIIDFISIKK